jgi:hypothetical protein
MATFSIVANTFSVLGLADVVCRATTELYALILRASSASNSATQLLTAVQSLATVVTEVRLWAAAYEQSLFAQEDSQYVSNNIVTALEKCGKQIRELVQRLAGVTIAKKNWFQRISGRVAFALSEEQIRHSLRMVDYHQTTLKGLMLVRGGYVVHCQVLHSLTYFLIRNDVIILRREMGHINAKLRNIETNIPFSYVHATCTAMGSSTRNAEPDNESKVISALERQQKVLERIASQTQELRTRRDLKNASYTLKVMTPGQNDQIRCHNDGIDVVANQHDRWIAQHQRHIHESFKKWRWTKLLTSTCFAQILGSFHLDQEPDGRSSVISDVFRPSNITLSLMLMRDKLHHTLFELSNQNKSWSYPVPEESTPLNCRRKGHACGQCVGPEARWVLRNIRSLMKQAHASSYLAEDSTVINMLSQPELNGSSLQETACQHGPIQGYVTRKPFYHQRTLTDATGVLRTKWASFTFEAFVFDFFSFACITDRSLTKKAEGFAVAFARVSHISTDQLYRPLHLKSLHLPQSVLEYWQQSWEESWEESWQLSVLKFWYIDT